jgi:putative iron-regulated protein
MDVFDGCSRLGVRGLAAALFLVPVACGVAVEQQAMDTWGPYEDPDEDEKLVIEGYADLAETSYEGALDKATALRDSIDAFVAAPSDGGLLQTKAKYLEAQSAFQLTEALRSYGGPVDARWGRMNAWRMEPSYIDYIASSPEAGIINDTTTHPIIDADVIASLSQAGSQRNVAAGLQAIEFLLWGEDLDPDGFGARKASDYLVGPEASASNGDRRGQYLSACAALLVDDLTALVSDWSDAGNGRALLQQQEVGPALTLILQGGRHLAGTEVADHLLGAGLAYDPEGALAFDELSPFADRTNEDLKNLSTALSNLYFGIYEDESSEKTLSFLVSFHDKQLDTQIQEGLAEADAAAGALSMSYDKAVLDAGGKQELMRLEAAMWEVSNLFAEAGLLLMLDVGQGDDGDGGAPMFKPDMMP